MSYDLLALETNTVVPGFRALGPSMAKSALNPGSALFPISDLEHFENLMLWSDFEIQTNQKKAFLQ